MIVFVHIPKTAGSTFRFILENNYGMSACNTNDLQKKKFNQNDLKFTLKFYPFLKSISGHNLQDVTSLEIYNPFYITFLRDPIARTLSHYQDHIISTGDFVPFNVWFENKEYHNAQVNQIAGENNLEKAIKNLRKFNFVGLTEEFNLSLHALSTLLPEDLNYKYLKIRSHKTQQFKSLVINDNKLMQLVKTHNSLDIALYNFARDKLFQKFCQDAGYLPGQKVTSLEQYKGNIHLRFKLAHFYNKIYRQAAKINAYLTRE